MKTTTEPPIEKFSVNGLEFTRTFDDMSLHWHAATDAGECIQLLKNSGMPWAWKCARSEWQDIGPDVIHGIHASDAPAMAAIALADAARYFRTLADSFGVPDKAEGVSGLKAEIDKTTRDAGDFAVTTKVLIQAIRHLTKGTASPNANKLADQAEELIKLRGYTDQP